jgi:type IV pilus assembly protein PilV
VSMSRKKRQKNIFSDSRGFSLLEVLLGMTIFMIGMLGVTALNISSLKSNTFSGNMSEAVILAGHKFEELMAADYDDPDLLAGDHFQDTLDNTTGKPKVDADGLIVGDGGDDIPDLLGKNGIYRTSWTVTDDDPLPENNKTVNLTVEWSVKDVKRTISMSTIILDHN